MIELPAGFVVKEATGGGDCFFDSIAQGLRQLKPASHFTVKSLRKVCQRFAQSQLEVDQSWLKEALKDENEKFNEYIPRIEFTGTDIEQNLTELNILDLDSPIWGRSEVEGRIICIEFNVKLHVVEKHVVEGKELWIHQLVEYEGSRSVNDVNYDNEENMVHIVNTGNLHFQPILKIQKFHQDDQIPNFSDCNNAIRAEEKLIHIMDTNDLQGKKLSETGARQLKRSPKLDTNLQGEHSDTPSNIAGLDTDKKITIHLKRSEIAIDSQTIAVDPALQLPAKKENIEVVHNQQNTNIKSIEGKLVSRLTAQNGLSRVQNYIVQISQSREESQQESISPSEEDFYYKNPHAGKTEGYSYQVKLSMLFLLCGKEKIKNKEITHFYLATDMMEAQGFENVVFKWHEESCGSRVTFLQSKHKERDNCVTKDTLLEASKKDFNLSKCFSNYLKIKNRFSSKKVDNPIFGQDFSDLDSSFVIFTNALADFSDDKNIYKVKMHPQDILNLSSDNNNYHYRLSPNAEIDAALLEDTCSSKKDELAQFFSKLQLFFGQPNETELGEIIMQKIQSVYSVSTYDIDRVFASVQNKIQEWHRKKGKSDFLTNGNRFFEDSARISIKFDVVEPVALFTGRAEQLDDLHRTLQNGGQAAISQMASVTGLGGVGKSELARKYISERSNDYDNNIIWINADSYLTIVESFSRVAEEKLGINIRDERGNKKKIQLIVDDVYQFFAQMHRKSLFVFDNAGKYRAYGENDEGIDRFLPPGPNRPHFLITTRDQKYGQIKTLPLDVFTEGEASEYIRKALKDVVDLEESEIKGLVAELQYLPLGLAQAMAYIRMENIGKNTPEDGKFTVNDYLQLFKEKASELLSKGSNDTVDRYTETIMTTWEITIKRINERRSRGGELAREVLNIIAYLAPDKIPIDALFSDLINDEDLRHSVIELLDQYSMATLHRGKLSIHRLVQHVTRIKLDMQGISEDVLDEVFILLEKSFPHGSDNLEGVLRKRNLLPHLETFSMHINDLRVKKPEDAKNIDEYCLQHLLYWMGETYFHFGDPKRSKQLLKRVLHITENQYGPNHVNVASTLVNLASTYGDLGNPYKQKELLERAIRINEGNYEPNHIKVATTLANLGTVFGNLGDPHKQKELLERALPTIENNYGSTHVQTAIALANLGNAYGHIGNPKKKKELLQRALKINEDHYGRNHFKVSAILITLGNTYGALGDSKTEKEQLERALSINEDFYGPNHFQVATTLVNLGIAYGNLGNQKKKKELLERALKIYEDFYEPNHFVVATTLVNLGNAHGALGDHKKRKELLERALIIMKHHPGPNRLKMATALLSLGNAYGALGNFFQQKELLKQALKIEEDYFGPSHFEVAIVLLHLSNAYEGLGDCKKQKELLERALKINEDYYGPNHYQVAVTLVNLGCAHGNLGEQEKKKELLEQALVMMEEHYGANHFQVASTLVNLGNAYGSLGDQKKNVELLERALEIKKDYFGPHHFEVASTLLNLSNVHAALGNIKNQKELLERALIIKKDHYGFNHFEVAATLSNLGVAYGKLDDYQKKKELLEQALAITEDYYGPDPLQATNMLENLAFTYEALDNKEEKIRLLERVLKIKEGHYGPKHIKIAATLVALGNAYGDLNDHYKKKELLQRALLIIEENYGPNHVDVGATLYHLCDAYAALDDPNKQKELLERILLIQEHNFGPNHIHFAMALVKLSNTHGVLGHFDKQKAVLERAVPILESYYGTNNSFVKAVKQAIEQLAVE